MIVENLKIGLQPYAVMCKFDLDRCKNKNFAKEFIKMRSEAYKSFHNGLIISNSHGIDYFNNVIKYWDNPLDYLNNNLGYRLDKDKKSKNSEPKLITEKDISDYRKKPSKDDYEMNFVLILLDNKGI